MLCPPFLFSVIESQNKANKDRLKNLGKARLVFQEHLGMEIRTISGKTQLVKGKRNKYRNIVIKWFWEEMTTWTLLPGFLSAKCFSEGITSCLESRLKFIFLLNTTLLYNREFTLNLLAWLTNLNYFAVHEPPECLSYIQII